MTLLKLQCIFQSYLVALRSHFILKSHSNEAEYFQYIPFTPYIEDLRFSVAHFSRVKLSSRIIRAVFRPKQSKLCKCSAALHSKGMKMRQEIYKMCM